VRSMRADFSAALVDRQDVKQLPAARPVRVVAQPSRLEAIKERLSASTPTAAAAPVMVEMASDSPMQIMSDDPLQAEYRTKYLTFKAAQKKTTNNATQAAYDAHDKARDELEAVEAKMEARGIQPNIVEWAVEPEVASPAPKAKAAKRTR
jgi:hypothetical protein